LAVPFAPPSVRSVTFLALGAWTLAIGLVAAGGSGCPVGPVAAGGSGCPVGPVAAVRTRCPIRPIAVPALRSVTVGSGSIRPIVAVAIGRTAILTSRAVSSRRPVGIPRGPIVRGIPPSGRLRVPPLEGLGWLVRALEGLGWLVRALEGLGWLVRAAGRSGSSGRPIGAAARGRFTGPMAVIGARVGAVLVTRTISAIRPVAAGPAVGSALTPSRWAIAGRGRTIPGVPRRVCRTIDVVAAW